MNNRRRRLPVSCHAEENNLKRCCCFKNASKSRAAGLNSRQPARTSYAYMHFLLARFLLPLYYMRAGQILMPRLFE